MELVIAALLAMQNRKAKLIASRLSKCCSRLPYFLARAGARRDVVYPIALYCFVGPEIDADSHFGRLPNEPFAKLQIRADFLETHEDDVKIPAGRSRATRRVDRHDRGPFALQRRRQHLRKRNARKGEDRPACLGANRL